MAKLSAVPDSLMQAAPVPFAVAVKLVLRLFDDLRWVVTLAGQGYPAQALTLVASMYEGAYTIAFIGADDGLAQEWVDHDDPIHPFRPAYDLTERGFANFGVPNPHELADQEYRNYRQFCWAKHLSPILESQRGLEVQAGAAVLKNGPDASEDVVRAAWFALEAAAGYAFVGLASVIYFHLVGKIPQSLGDRVDELGGRRRTLNDAAKARWPQNDPFPGKW